MATVTVNEVRVRLHAPLRDARLVDPSAPLPALPRTQPEATAPSEENPSLPLRADRVVAPSAELREPPPPAPPPPVNLWETEIGRRLEEDRAHIVQTLAAVAQKVRDLHEERRKERQEWRHAAVELGVTLAARLLHDRIVAGDFPVETLVRELIDEATSTPDRRQDGAPVVVFLNPEDLALLRRRLEDHPFEPRPEGFSFEVDPGLGRGDCRVESGDAIVLSQLDVQLAEMRRRLLRSLGHAQV